MPVGPLRARDELRTWGSGVSCLWAQRVVPLAMEVVASQNSTRFKGFHLVVGDFEAGGVGGGVQFGVHAEATGRPGRSDGVDDDFVAGQRPATPVHRDV